MKAKFLSLLFILTSLVTACAQATSISTPSPKPITQIVATQTPPPPTRPRATPTLAETVPLPTPTLDSGFPKMNVESSAALSPNGEWVNVSINVWSADGANVLFQRQVLSVTDPNLQWTYVSEQSGVGLGMTFPSVIHWSADGQKMYFADRGQPDGCGLPFISGLKQLNLNDGRTKTVGREAYWPLAFSPDDKTVVYGGLKLLDLETQAVRSASISLSATQFVVQTNWSPDNQHLLVRVAETNGDVCAFNAWPTTLLLVDVETLTVKPVLENDARAFFVIDWPTPNRALLNDKDGGQWCLELATGALTSAP